MHNLEETMTNTVVETVNLFRGWYKVSSLQKCLCARLNACVELSVVANGSRVVWVEHEQVEMEIHLKETQNGNWDVKFVEVDWISTGDEV